jgi:3-oxoacyl-[acyl-carrier protein] reductase
VISFKNKTVIISGASRGIGLGIAKAFFEQGANVGILSRHVGKAEVLMRKAKNQDHKVRHFTADVLSNPSIERAVRAAADYFGSIDIVCSNVGIFPNLKMEEIRESAWEDVMNINARGTFFLVQATLPYLKCSADGRIVITSSITGPITGYKGYTLYGASKAAQLGFMRSAALELAPYHITINAVLPGNIVTEGFIGSGKEYRRQMEASIPLKRLGLPEDVANAVLFLSSEKSGYITGQTIIVDGGQTLPENLYGF